MAENKKKATEAEVQAPVAEVEPEKTEKAENQAPVAEVEPEKTEKAENQAPVNGVAKPKKPAKVKIKLPITRSEKDDEIVVLNGKSYLIKRGYEVEVPYGVAKILERKEKRLQIALAYEEAAAQGLDGIDKN